MKIIITSGGTSEQIDGVRSISNNSSGKLGSIIANYLSKNGNQIEKIFYLCAKNSILPEQQKNIEIIYVSNVESLVNAMKQLISSQKIDIVIHSMAVSDYTVDYITNSANLSNLLENKNKNEIENILKNFDKTVDIKTKISSNVPDIIIKLKQTPKVISMIKKWDKNIFLIGFKLLVNVSKDKLIDTAKQLMIKNDCDVVVANDKKNITKTEHKAYIQTKKGDIFKANTKVDIANIIAKIINERNIND